MSARQKAQIWSSFNERTPLQTIHLLGIRMSRSAVRKFACAKILLTIIYELISNKLLLPSTRDVIRFAALVMTLVFHSKTNYPKPGTLE